MWEEKKKYRDFLWFDGREKVTGLTYLTLNISWYVNNQILFELEVHQMPVLETLIILQFTEMPLKTVNKSTGKK